MNRVPSLSMRIEEWLTANKLRAEDVRHGSFPHGMVARWIERAEEAEQGRDRERARADRAEAALAKLVALKDGPRGTEYGRNKPAAWEAARAALSAGSGGRETTA